MNFEGGLGRVSKRHVGGRWNKEELKNSILFIYIEIKSNKDIR